MNAYWVWNPDREAFHIPFIDFPIYWYSLFFALGFYGAVVIARSLVRSRAIALVGRESADFHAIDTYIERLALYGFIGIIIGARLGHVLFYEPYHYLTHPFDVILFRQGGLSSHGAVIGLCVALWRFQKKYGPALPYLPVGADLLDLISISSAWTAGCIRIGNFFNQEIVGTITSVPWAVVFLSPVDGEGGVPRHPTQLYEACTAFLLLIPLLLLGRGGRFAQDGRIAGWYVIILFSFRVVLELFKTPQCDFDVGCLHVGQLLSLPAILLGIGLVVRARVRKRMKDL